MAVDAILQKLVPNEIKDFINGLIKHKEEYNFEKTPSDLQMVIIILKGGKLAPEIAPIPGPIMDRYQKPPLPRNPFQI